jgi:hypothetical protein
MGLVSCLPHRFAAPESGGLCCACFAPLWLLLQNGAGAGDRIGGTPAFPWPKPDKPMMFWAQLGPEEISASGGHGSAVAVVVKICSDVAASSACLTVLLSMCGAAFGQHEAAAPLGP